jgi:hypothetical protein
MLDTLPRLITLILDNRTWLALIVLGLLFVLARVQPMVRGWRFRLGVWGVVLLGLGGVAAINYVVNPYGLYPTRYFEPILLLTRNLKMNQFEAQPRPPELLVLGSSRTFTIDPVQLEALWGCPAYNAGLTAGRVPDFLAFTRFTLQNPSAPQIVILDLAYESLLVPNDLDSVEPNSRLNVFYDTTSAQNIFTSWQQGMQLLSMEQLRATLNLLQAEASGRPEAGIQFAANGKGSFSQGFQDVADNATAIEIRVRAFQPGMEVIRGLPLLEQYLTLVQTNSIQVIGYLPPRRPDLQNQLRAEPGFQQIQAEVGQQYARLQAQYPHFQVLDFQDDPRFDDPTLFVDVIHPTAAASALMMERLHAAFGETVRCE